mgnify:CR=1 FL=1
MELLPFGQIQTKKQLFEWIDALKGTYPESEKDFCKVVIQGDRSVSFL